MIELENKYIKEAHSKVFNHRSYMTYWELLKNYDKLFDSAVIEVLLTVKIIAKF